MLQYPIGNLHYFENVILINHQVEQSDYFPGRIYTFSDDDIITSNIKTIDLTEDADCYDDCKVTDEYKYFVLLRYIKSNKPLVLEMPGVPVTGGPSMTEAYFCQAIHLFDQVMLFVVLPMGSQVLIYRWLTSYN